MCGLYLDPNLREKNKKSVDDIYEIRNLNNYDNLNFSD